MGGFPPSPENLSDVACLDPRAPATARDSIVHSPTVAGRRNDSVTLRILDLDLKEHFPSETTLEAKIPVTLSLVEHPSDVASAGDVQLEEFPHEHKLLMIIPAGPVVKHAPPTDEQSRVTAAALIQTISSSLRWALVVVLALYRACRRSAAAAWNGFRSAMRHLAPGGVRMAQATARFPITFGRELKSRAQSVASAIPADRLRRDAMAGWAVLRSASTRLTSDAVHVTQATARRSITIGRELKSRAQSAAIPTSGRSFLVPTLIVASIIVVAITRWNATDVNPVEARPPALASTLPADIATVTRRETPPDNAARRDESVRGVAPPVAPAIAPAPTSKLRAADTAVIQRVLNRYRDANSILSVSGVRAVWPSVDTVALRATFGRLAELNLEFDSCKISADDIGALAICHGVAQFVPAGARTTTTERRAWHFTLHHVDRGWVIAKVAAR